MEDKVDEELKNYPSQFEPASVKKSDSYGIQYFAAMWAEYSNSNLANSTESRQQRYINLRKYSEGLQSIDKYKDQVSSGGDTSYMNLDWQSISVIPKFKEVIVNGMLNADYKIQCNAIDKLSANKKDKKRNELMGNMFMASKINELPEHVREKLLPKNAEIPQDIEELELYMNLNYKQAVEIAMEQGIEFTLYNNDWKTIAAHVLEDLVVLKIAGTRSYFDENDDIRLRYIDPINFMSSFTTESNYKRLRHAGEILSITIAELRVAAQNKFTEEQYFNIAKTYSGRNNNRRWTYGDYYNFQEGSDNRYDDFLIDVLDGEFYSADEFTFEKKENGYGGYYFQDKEDGYKAPKKSKRKREVVRKNIETVYSGKWIIGSKHIYDYKLKENMLREKVNGTYSTQTQMSFNIIAPGIRDMENKSLVEMMMPFADLMQIIHLKIQQHVARSRPKGLAVDVSAITGVMKGAGFDSFKPVESQKMFDQIGSYYYSSVRSDGSPIMGKPIEELQNGISNEIQHLIALYNQYLQQIRDVTGVNEVRDASAPDKSALVGVDKLRLMASNNATRSINLAYLDIYERTAKTVALMIQDSVDNGNKIEGYYNAIGEQNVKTLKLTSGDISLHEIGIKIEALPDEEERQIVEGNIQQSLANDTLRLEDSIHVRQVLKQSVKLANQLLIQRRKQYQKEKAMEVQQASELNAQAQQQSLMLKAQTDQQSAEQKSMIEKGKLEVEYDLKSGLSAQEHEQKMKEIALANQYKAEQIVLAGDENFKNTALSQQQKQPSVYSGASK